ncbi:hypothetical protein ARMSODRAFT_983182 [Armillaria solidipes]|uniref:Uncharacterized protein n=1 Tax=Armillaria solidipes TaxID=1076256 RepID=A0A2H3AK16_9AGAR|nr:hypothetical protein ARMSODRAFT_983182 [Armillaria solidipes]
MKLEDFAAGVNQLHPLLNPDKRSQYRAKEIARRLQDSTPFLIQILRLSRQAKTHPAASFARDLLYTCETIVTELPANLRLPSFVSWELRMSEQSGRIKIDEDMPLPEVFLAALSGQGWKRKVPPCDDSGNEDASGDDDDEEQGDATSGDEGSDDESEDGSDESEEEVVPKDKGAAKTQKQKASSPKKKFTTPKEPEVSLSITVPVGPPKKTPKTQPGSVKDEPVPMASSSRGARTSQRPKGKGEEKPVASSSKVAAPVTVTIKNKKHLALSTHRYGREIPVPVKDEEIDHITQASTVPQYGCAQCSSSVQNQACVFLGWGKRCNNCEAATKSLCSFHAEPIQRYHAHKELAKFVEVTPDNVRTSIGRTSAALQVFETCANATAQAAQQYRASLEETLTICQDAAANEGSNALRGIVFESRDFEDQLRVALIKVDRYSSTPLNTTKTSSFDQIVAQALGKPPLRTNSPSLPVIEGSGVIATPARSREVSVTPKDDSDDELGALMNPTTSSPCQSVDIALKIFNDFRMSHPLFCDVRLRTSSSNASEVSELAIQVSTLLRYTSDSLSVTSGLSQNCPITVHY